MIKNIFMDLDDTLLDFHKAERIALRKTLQRLDIAPTEAVLARYSEINAAQWQLLELGKLNRNEVKERRYQLLFDEIGVSHSAAEATAIYEKYLAQGHYFIEGAEQLLETLAPRYHLFLASNGTLQVQKGRIASAGIAPYFDNIFISEEIGADKPSVSFFEHCFAQIPDFSKAETVMVGDSLTSDIQGGKNAGISTIWFHTGTMPDNLSVRPDYQLEHLIELPQLLLQIEADAQKKH